MKLVTKTVQMIEMQDWDALVSTTYGKQYRYQQQDGCMPRGVYTINVPAEDWGYENDTVVEECNGPEQGVSFKAWLSRDPEQKLVGQEYDYELSTWWDRCFYPHINEVINDLHAKGLLDAGEYIINIDW